MANKFQKNKIAFRAYDKNNPHQVENKKWLIYVMLMLIIWMIDYTESLNYVKSIDMIGLS